MKGSCLCNKVSYEITPPFKTFQYCHCSRCRKFTGSAMAPNIMVSPAQFNWVSGEEFVGRYEVPDAKYYATSFCKSCGSSLPWLIQGGRNVIVPAGTLDDDPEIKPQQNIYWGSKASWFESPCQLVQYDTLPDRNTK